MPLFQRRHYEVVAAALRDLFERGDKISAQRAAERLSRAFADDNPRFDEGRFREASTTTPRP